MKMTLKGLKVFTPIIEWNVSLDASGSAVNFFTNKDYQHTSLVSNKMSPESNQLCQWYPYLVLPYPNSFCLKSLTPWINVSPQCLRKFGMLGLMNRHNKRNKEIKKM